MVEYSSIYLVKNGDLLKENCQVAINSVGEDWGYGGIIAGHIEKHCGAEIIAETKKAAMAKYHKER